MTSKVIVDTDFLIGLFIKTDAHNTNCRSKFDQINNIGMIITSLVKYEFVTLISRRQNQQLALNLLEELYTLNIQEYYIEQKDDDAIMKESMSHQTKKISVVDCANLVIAKKLNAKIASFDRFYPDNMMIF
jgi:predicted nucleic acid-binding protein